MYTVKIQQSLLLGGLQTVSKAINSHIILSILSNVLLTFTDSALTLSVTDLQIGIETTIPIESCSAPFSTTIPAEIFTGLIETIPDEVVELKYNEDTCNMEVIGKRSKHNISCVSSNDFPELPKHPSKSILKIDTKLFVSTISRVIFSSSNDMNKPVLNSVILSMEDDQLIAYSTDGFRMSLRSITLPAKIPNPIKVNIPVLAASRMVDTLSGEYISFYLTENTITAISGNTIIHSQIVDGKAPDYKLIQTLVSSVERIAVKVDANEFSLLCKQANIFASKDEHKFLKMDMDLTGITISSNAQQIGNSKGHINVIVEGQPISIAVSSEYIREFLNASKASLITIKVENHNKPVVFYIDELPGYWHMIMPIVL